MIKTFLKKFGYILAILVIVVVAAINMNVNSNKYELSDMSLANVEALATREGAGDTICSYPYTGVGALYGYDDPHWDVRWECGFYVGYPCVCYIYNLYGDFNSFCAHK